MSRDRWNRFWLLVGLAIGLLISAALTFGFLVGCFLATAYIALVIGIGEACYVGTLRALRKVLMEDAEREASQPTRSPQSPSSDTA